MSSFDIVQAEDQAQNNDFLKKEQDKISARVKEERGSHEYFSRMLLLP